MFGKSPFTSAISVLSKPKTLCKASSASWVLFWSIRQLILTSLVEIILIFIPKFAKVLNILAAIPGLPIIPAPTIERLSAQEDGEVARVKITYPANAKEKIYKVNYGEKQNYTKEISIEKYGTEIIAYYKTAEGKTSNYKNSLK